MKFVLDLEEVSESKLSNFRVFWLNSYKEVMKFKRHCYGIITNYAKIIEIHPFGNLN